MEERDTVCFLSEEARSKHRTYAEGLFLREEVLRKGRVRDERTLIELYRQRKRQDTETLYAVAAEAFSHRLYFSSFSEYPTVSDAFCRRFGGLTSFFQRVKEESMAAGRYLYLGTDARGALVSSDRLDVYMRMHRLPCLCVDVCEHAYFLDYGFEREAYVRAAVSHLDVARLLK